MPLNDVVVKKHIGKGLEIDTSAEKINVLISEEPNNVTKLVEDPVGVFSIFTPKPPESDNPEMKCKLHEMDTEYPVLTIEHGDQGCKFRLKQVILDGDKVLVFMPF